jgi:hypothetical protein
MIGTQPKNVIQETLVTNCKALCTSVTSVLILLMVSSACWAQTPGGAKNTTDVVALLEKSGYHYSKVSDGVWEITFKGNNVGEFAVRIALGGEILIVMAKVDDRKSVQLQPAFLAKLLEFNDKFDTVKVALSSEMLYVRSDTHVRIPDVQELKYLLEQISGAVDEMYPQVKQYLSGAK